MKHIAVCMKKIYEKKYVLKQMEILWSEEGITCDFDYYDNPDMLQQKMDKGCRLCIFDISSFGNSGFYYLKKISEERPELWFVFFDNNPQNAICGFDYPAVSYLIYPISNLDLISAARKIRRVFPDWFKEPGTELTFGRSRFWVPFSKIEYIQCINRVLFINLNDGTIIKSYGSITGVLEKLPDFTFCRIQKSYVVNLLRIETIESKYTIIMDSGNLLPVGKKYADEFNKKIDELLI